MLFGGFLRRLKASTVKNIELLDDPGTVSVHADIIRKKTYLKNIYREYYISFKERLGCIAGHERIVELGSGGGFIKDIIPSCICSDIVPSNFCDISFSALCMPFKDNTIDAFCMINVLHHLPDVERFFKEVARCLRDNGHLLMIEPANTPWNRFVHRNFHHERFDPQGDWKFESVGPLSSANGAIPWIVFFRDRVIFEQRFPSLKVKAIDFHTPLRYLISGGFSFPQLLPRFTYCGVKALEKALSIFNNKLAMFLTIHIRKEE